MRIGRQFALGGLLYASIGLANLFPSYEPLTYTQSDGSSLPADNGTVFKLSSDGTTPSILVLDYERNVEGYATFQVIRSSGNTSVFEMSYSETRALLDNYMADGPLPLAAAMDTYRIDRYNITNQTAYTNHLIQGALRYQKLNLSSAGELELSFLGFIPTVDNLPLSDLPGSFNCSDPVLNRIWGVGARTVQLNEFPANSLPDFWVITDEGALVDSLAPQPFAADFATALTTYELDFSVKPMSNGFGFTVLSDTLGNGIYIFVDVAHSSISAHSGSTELDTLPLVSAILPSTVSLNKWHTVHSTVNNTDITVDIDGLSLLNFSQSSSSFGSFGLGASLGHSAIFTNVSLTAFGTKMYSSPLTNSSALQDFLLGTNPLPVSVDGSRRDRIAYAGDLDITTGTAFASTYGHDYINGSINLLGSFQLLPGFFVPSVKVQQPPRTEDIQANITGLIGYSFSLASAMAQYYEQTGDTGFLTYWAPKAARLFDWAHSQTLGSGLLNISNPAFGGDWNYYDPPLSGVVAKFNLVYAYALNRWLPFMADGGLNTTLYTSRLESLQNAINANLWSDTLQAYYLSESYTDFFSQEANALAILSNTASGNHTANTILDSLSRELYVRAGALAFSNASSASGWAQKISPYASGYHLKAAFHANDSTNAKKLLHSVWGPMSDPSHTNYNGCTWETLDADGTPGLGAPTSLCHAWGAGPTADLSRYVLGIQPLVPGFKQWQIVPQTLGLQWARGSHPVPRGTIDVSWSFNNSGLLEMTVIAPPGTDGTVYLPSPLQTSLKGYQVSGCTVVNNSTFLVKGGQVFTFRQTK